MGTGHVLIMGKVPLIGTLLKRQIGLSKNEVPILGHITIASVLRLYHF